MLQKRIIGVVGMISSGKDTVANYIASKYSFVHISTGDLVRRYILDNKLGDISDRSFLQKIANDLRVNKGEDYLVKVALEDSSKNLVISGLRAVSEVECIKNNGGKVIKVESPIEQRYARSINRGRIDGIVTFEDFKKQQEVESNNKTLKSMNVNKVLEMSDYTIINDSTEELLFEKVDKLTKLFLIN